MKILVISFASCVLLILSNYYHVTDGQNFNMPKRFYKTIKFDKIIRGGYNITDCLKELLNCWEVVKPDVICSADKFRTTVCEMLKDSCDDYDGLIDEKLGSRLTLFETYCKSDSQSEWT